MNNLIEFLIAPYRDYSPLQIGLEITASFFGILSVIFSKNRNIWVYPTGIISTFLYIYLFFSWGLYGETLINLYYTSMSFYGWILWNKKTEDDNIHVEVEWALAKDYLKSIWLFVTTFLFILLLYHFRPIIDGIIPYRSFATLTWNYTFIDFVDATLTGVFLIGMWLMARRKIDNWIFWIVGDIVMIPLLLYKGYGISSLQYFIFTIIAYQGLLQWKKSVIRNEKSLSS
ncbi:nicotinamide riboside transporter PnuC [Faecalibacter rhinopitheci]|uniref:Nicotinamide riboside transporter PnuC n=1 Tax=Faecalibacter rhinopitheci TaxID=2779678 RepID=A0A8J7KDP1_9FLAO|nr:nicotinamide riboside transporter PnuC [Faecalibacter rhinopitheci]MBF0597556.1 nicotinamide mononucleotide transporter [Faecalibacter rhinopitheci]MBQ0147913.1 nicotinamide mononucleotide transporter [Candidatus Onthonaster equi]